jgi:hypothetical protein
MEVPAVLIFIGFTSSTYSTVFFNYAPVDFIFLEIWEMNEVVSSV